MNPKIGFDFQITHRQEGDKHMIEFSPSVKNAGYPNKVIEFSQEQWEGLKYHFASAIDDKTGTTKLTYIF